jgi:hypothetical protein
MKLMNSLWIRFWWWIIIFAILESIK